MEPKPEEQPDWLAKLKLKAKESDRDRLAALDAVMRDMEQVRTTPLVG